MDLMQKIVIFAVPVLFAVTMHEIAHGYMAKWLGDRTASILGRLSLNPIKHIDPMGTVIVPILLVMAGGFVFGWAKPVPVSSRNLKKPLRDMAIIGLVGPLSNVIMAIIWGVLSKVNVLIAHKYHPEWTQGFHMMCMVGIQINFVLAWLNILPLPPLDGGHVLLALVPRRLAYYIEKIEPIGMWILLVLMFMGILPLLLQQPVDWSSYYLMKKLATYKWLKP